jgi:RNA polymerase subunit RPABC4/transcription elongation factor Spt4
VVRYAIALVGAYLFALWVSMVIWTFRDIRDRTRDPYLQVLAVALVAVFNLGGLWLYLILRPRETLSEAYERSLEEEALLQELDDQQACPNCKRRVQDEFVICPSCRMQLKEACVNCGRPLSYVWVACPYCATDRRIALGERVEPLDAAEAHRALEAGNGRRTARRGATDPVG